MPLPYGPGNPIVYDNDGPLESGYADAYVMALASAGIINLRGMISTGSYGEWSRVPPYNQSPPEQKVAGRQALIDTARRSGFFNVPNATAGSSVSFESRRPASGVIADTVPLDTPGGRLIVTEALQASPTTPLVVIMGGQATAVADAYLLNPAIANRVRVAWIMGNKASATQINSLDYNIEIDPWATYIVTERLQTVVFPYTADGNDFNDSWPITPQSRWTEVPDKELSRLYLSLTEPNRGVEPDSTIMMPLTRQDYVTQTKTFRFSQWESRFSAMRGFSVNCPIYVEDATGPILSAWVLNEPVGTSEWWTRMKDPAVWHDIWAPTAPQWRV